LSVVAILRSQPQPGFATPMRVRNQRDLAGALQHRSRSGPIGSRRRYRPRHNRPVFAWCRCVRSGFGCAVGRVAQTAKPRRALEHLTGLTACLSVPSMCRADLRAGVRPFQVFNCQRHDPIDSGHMHFDRTCRRLGEPRSHAACPGGLKAPSRDLPVVPAAVAGTGHPGALSS